MFRQRHNDLAAYPYLCIALLSSCCDIFQPCHCLVVVLGQSGTAIFTQSGAAARKFQRDITVGQVMRFGFKQKMQTISRFLTLWANYWSMSCLTLISRDISAFVGHISTKLSAVFRDMQVSPFCEGISELKLIPQVIACWLFFYGLRNQLFVR